MEGCSLKVVIDAIRNYPFAGTAPYNSLMRHWWTDNINKKKLDGQKWEQTIKLQDDKKERKTHKAWKSDWSQYHNSMQETWWKWARWRNYIKYEADILINQTKMSIEWKEKAKSYANQKDNEIWKIQSPYSWATIIRTIPLRFRLPNSLPPQKDDIWGSGGGGNHQPNSN